MKVLELFKGTGSISKYLSIYDDIEVVSLDILEKFNPDICIDIMDWDYKTDYPINYFDIIWASPECKIYSSLQNTWVGRKWKNLDELNQKREENKVFINRAIEIIKYFNPKYYFIENPRYSKIWDYIDDDDIKNKYLLVDYCRFGTIYKKSTKILTNIYYENKLCCCNGKHKFILGMNLKTARDPTTTLIRYQIPHQLLDYLFNPILSTNS